MQAWATAGLHIAGGGRWTGARDMFGPWPVTEPTRWQSALLLDGRQEVAEVRRFGRGIFTASICCPKSAEDHGEAGGKAKGSWPPREMLFTKMKCRSSAAASNLQKPRAASLVYDAMRFKCDKKVFRRFSGCFLTGARRQMRSPQASFGNGKTETQFARW